MTRPGGRVLVVIGLGLILLAGAVAYYSFTSGPSREYKAAQEAINRRDFRTASELLDTHLANNPRDTEARLLAARTARRRGAVDEFQKHMDLHKQQQSQDRARAQEFRLLRLQTGDLSEAEELLDAALAKPEDLASPLALEAVIESTLAVLKPRSGQSFSLPAGGAHPVVVIGRRAVDAWLQSRPATVDQMQGKVWRGRIKAAASDYEGAVADLTSVLTDDPDHFDARLQLALTIAQDKPREASVHLVRLREQQPANELVLTQLAGAYRMSGRLEASRAILNELSTRQDENATALLELGLLELDANRHQEAEPVLRRALKLAPKSSVVHLAMGRCMTLAGKPDEARRFMNQFASLEIEEKRPWRVPPKP